MNNTPKQCPSIHTQQHHATACQSTQHNGAQQTPMHINADQCTTIQLNTNTHARTQRNAMQYPATRHGSQWNASERNGQQHHATTSNPKRDRERFNAVIQSKTITSHAILTLHEPQYNVAQSYATGCNAMPCHAKRCKEINKSMQRNATQCTAT